MPAIKGTASVPDTRALNKALKKANFPANFSIKVSLKKVNKPVLTQWIEQRITAILGFEDDIVQSTAVNLFLPTPPEDGNQNVVVDPKTAQIDMAGFLGDEQAAKFASELWGLLLDAQASPMGIPKKLLDEKKKELAAAKQQSEAQRPPPRKAPPPAGVAVAAAAGAPQPRPNAPTARPVSPPHPADRDHDGPRRTDSSHFRRDGDRWHSNSSSRRPDDRSADGRPRDGPQLDVYGRRRVDDRRREIPFRDEGYEDDRRMRRPDHDRRDNNDNYRRDGHRDRDREYYRRRDYEEDRRYRRDDRDRRDSRDRERRRSRSRSRDRRERHRRRRDSSSSCSSSGSGN